MHVARLFTGLLFNIETCYLSGLPASDLHSYERYSTQPLRARRHCETAIVY